MTDIHRKDTLQYLYSIINSLDDQLMVIDRDYRIIEVNDTVLTNLNMTKQEILGEFCYRISHNSSEPCSTSRHLCPINSVWETGKPAKTTHIHEQQVNRAKEKHFVDIIASPIKDERGSVVAVVETIRDVTEAKNNELRIDQLNRELAEKDRIRGELLNETFNIQEEERKRIARELHDETAQVVASLAAQVESVINSLPKDEIQILTKLKRIRSLHTDLLSDINRLIYDLRPILLDDLGLDAAISWLVENKLIETGIKVEVRTRGLGERLPMHLETVVFRVVQEAINNITKHACANHVRINVNRARSTIKIEIIDDGKGFNVQDALTLKEGRRGLGLQGMKERTELVKGKISIKSDIDKGTQIIITIPL